jgi:hypothetical protein
MALKLALDGDAFKKLSDDLKKEYKEVEEDGKKVYKLDVDGLEDTGALKRAKDHEKKARTEAEAKVKELQTNLETIQNEIDDIRRGAIPKADVEKLETSWKTKLEKQKTEMSTALETARGSLKKLLVDNVAQSMATKISTVPDLILPHIRSRLTVDESSGEFVTKVLDKDGKPSAMSIEELQKEFTSNKSFAPILVGSRASGSGAPGTGANGGSAPARPDGMAKWSPKQMADHLADKKAAQGG